MLVVGGPSTWDVAIDLLVPVIPVRRPQPTGGSATEWVEVTFDNLNRVVEREYDPEFWLSLALSDQAFKVYHGEGGFVRVGRPGTGVPTETEPQSKRERVSDGKLDEIRRSLFRFWQVPARHRGLLPVRDRAQHGPNGKPLPLVAEAFTHQVTKFDVTESVHAKVRKIQEQERTAAASKKQAWRQQVDEIHRLQARLDRIELLTAKEILDYFTRVARGFGTDRQRAEVIRDDLLGVTDPSEDAGALDAALENTPPLQLLKLARYLNLLPDVSLERGEVTAEQLIQTIQSYGTSIVGGLLQLDTFTDVHEKRIEELKREIAESKVKALELRGQWDRVGAIRVQIAALDKKISLGRARNGKVSLGDNKALEDLKTLLREELEKQENEDVFGGPYDAPGVVNLPRQEIGVSVVDRELGVFRTEKQAAWVDDPLISPTAAENVAFPMPVRVTFGTRLTGPYPETTAEVAQNELVRGTLEQLGKLPGQELELLSGGIADVVPAFGTGDQARFLFGRNVRETDGTLRPITPIPLGEAQRLVLDPDLRLRVNVDGTSNLADIAAEAGQRARPLFLKAEGRDTGQMVFAGPQPQECNGRVSAVEWSLGADGIRTTVSFDPPESPLPGIENPAQQPAPTRFVFGLDEERVP